MSFRAALVPFLNLVSVPNWLIRIEVRRLRELIFLAPAIKAGATCGSAGMLLLNVRAQHRFVLFGHKKYSNAALLRSYIGVMCRETYIFLSSPHRANMRTYHFPISNPFSKSGPYKKLATNMRDI